MLNQGYMPGTGLGHENQGQLFPLSPQPCQDRSGLGYHSNLPRGLGISCLPNIDGL